MKKANISRSQQNTRKLWPTIHGLRLVRCDLWPVSGDTCSTTCEHLRLVTRERWPTTWWVDVIGGWTDLVGWSRTRGRSLGPRTEAGRGRGPVPRIGAGRGRGPTPRPARPAAAAERSAHDARPPSPIRRPQRSADTWAPTSGPARPPSCTGGRPAADLPAERGTVSVSSPRHTAARRRRTSRNISGRGERRRRQSDPGRRRQTAADGSSSHRRQPRQRRRRR